jgi:hypothetical protein
MADPTQPSGIRWTDLPVSGGSAFDPVANRGTFAVKDDFAGTTSTNLLLTEMGWRTASANSGTAGFVDGDANHPSVVQLASTATSGSGMTVLGKPNAIGGWMKLGANGTFTAWKTVLWMKTGANVSDMRFIFGFANSAAGAVQDVNASSNHLTLRRDATAQTCASGSHTTANWVLAGNVTGIMTECADTGVAIAANTWYKLEIYSNTPGVVSARVNDSNPVSIGTHVPAAYVAPFMHLSNTGSTSMTADLDYFAFYGTGMVR